jgi:hypothetical protein
MSLAYGLLLAVCFEYFTWKFIGNLTDIRLQNLIPLTDSLVIIVSWVMVLTTDELCYSQHWQEIFLF